MLIGPAGFMHVPKVKRYDEQLSRIEQALGDYAALLDKHVVISDVIQQAEELALKQRDKFPTVSSVLRDGRRIIRES